MKESIAVLMPKITDNERFTVRYSGLSSEIGKHGVSVAFAQSHTSYNPDTHGFDVLHDVDMNPVAARDLGRIAVVRDLTMPKADNQPMYLDLFSPTLVHDPVLNSYLRNKANMYHDLPDLHPSTIIASHQELDEAVAAIQGKKVVVKPVTGMASEGVFIGKKEDAGERADGYYMVQEFIDTHRGVSELDIDGVHNVRIVSIDSKIIGAVGRVNAAEAVMLQDDIYDKVYRPDELPESFLAISDSVHSTLKQLPSNGRNVIAIDVMRGVDASGEQVDVLCEVNRRPMRISDYDLLSPQRDPAGIAWISRQWDAHEATMLVKAL